MLYGKTKRKMKVGTSKYNLMAQTKGKLEKEFTTKI